MNITNEKATHELVISMPENLNLAYYKIFRGLYQNTKGKFSDYVIDFGNTKKVELCLFGMLLQLNEYVGTKARIHLINCSREMKLVFTISLLNEKFDVR